MNKKIIVSSLVILIVVVVGFVWWQRMGVPAPKYTGPVEKVTIGSYTGEYASLVYIADEKGYFKDEDIDLEIKPYEYGILTIPDVLNGTIDIGLANEFAPVVRSFDSPGFKIIASIDQTDSYELIARRDRGINTPADLKGKKVGIPKGSQSEFFLGTFLTFNRLSLTDVEVVYTKPFDLENAITSGGVDAILIWPPHSYTIAKKLGANAVVWKAQSGQDAYFVLIGSDDFLKERPRIVPKMLRALIKAETFVKNNTLEAQTIVMRRIKTDEEYINYEWPANTFKVSLEQAMVLAMEDEARFAIDKKITDQTKVPNYLDFIYVDALEALKPEAVTITR